MDAETIKARIDEAAREEHAYGQMRLHWTEIRRHWEAVLELQEKGADRPTGVKVMRQGVLPGSVMPDDVQPLSADELAVVTEWVLAGTITPMEYRLFLTIEKLRGGVD